MKKIAVLTGDIIDSGQIGNKKKLLSIEKTIFKEIKKCFSNNPSFELFRGDSFQGQTDLTYLAVRIGILIRAGLIKSTPIKEGNNKKLQAKLWDARISIGIGNSGFSSDKIVESEGEAFTLSGRNLDVIKKSSESIMVTSWDENFNQEFKAFSKLVNSIISKWSGKSAEIMYRALMYGETQKQMADALGISQTAVNKRLAVANYNAIKTFLLYSEKRIAELCQV